MFLKHTIWMTLLAFIGIQLQGTLYNYYYVILRHNSAGGDTTSKIFEDKSPKALTGETQKSVDIIIQNIHFGLWHIRQYHPSFRLKCLQGKNLPKLVYDYCFFIRIGFSTIAYCSAFVIKQYRNHCSFFHRLFSIDFYFDRHWKSIFKASI